MKHGKTFSVLIAMLTWRSSLSIRGGLHRQFEEQQQQWEISKNVREQLLGKLHEIWVTYGLCLSFITSPLLMPSSRYHFDREHEVIPYSKQPRELFKDFQEPSHPTSSAMLLSTLTWEISLISWPLLLSFYNFGFHCNRHINPKLQNAIWHESNC